MTGAVLIAAAAPVATHWSGDAGAGQAAELKQGTDGGLTHGSGDTGSGSNAQQGSSPAGQSRGARPTGSSAARQHAHRQAASHRQAVHHRQPPPVYQNPVRDIKGLIPERVDQGVDFGGTGPIYAIGKAVVTQATATNYGWPGGGWITYKLTSGPAAGLMVFVAEDVRPAVSAGDQVTSRTVIANMYNGGAGIETGWAMPNGFTAESQLAEAGGISGAGPFPTAVGMNFEELLQELGVPAANNRNDRPSGIVPSRYPMKWARSLKSS